MDLDANHCRGALRAVSQQANAFADLLPLLEAINLSTLKKFTEKEMLKLNDRTCIDVFSTLPISGRIMSMTAEPEECALVKPEKAETKTDSSQDWASSERDEYFNHLQKKEQEENAKKDAEQRKRKEIAKKRQESGVFY